MVYLTIEGETLVTTADHPFYTVAGEWVEAGDLRLGDDIRMASWATGDVKSVYIVTQPQPMYNFTVATAHTYFVGEYQWLVHNCQIHHALSNKIMRQLNEHSTLKDVFDREDDLFKFVALSDSAHRGYQTWHRQYDSDVVSWLMANPNANRNDFINYLISIYSRSEMVERFPDAIVDLRKLLDE